VARERRARGHWAGVCVGTYEGARMGVGTMPWAAHKRENQRRRAGTGTVHESGALHAHTRQTCSVSQTTHTMQEAAMVLPVLKESWPHPHQHSWPHACARTQQSICILPHTQHAHISSTQASTICTYFALHNKHTGQFGA